MTEATDKIKQPGELAEIARAARAGGQRVVLAWGVFDVLHAGHVHYLEKAGSLGDLLICAVHDDSSARRIKGPGRPLIPANERTETVAALRHVDYVCPLTSPEPVELVRTLEPDMVALGPWKNGGDVAAGQPVPKVVRIEEIAALTTEELIGRILQLTEESAG